MTRPTSTCQLVKLDNETPSFSINAKRSELANAITITNNVTSLVAKYFDNNLLQIEYHPQQTAAKITNKSPTPKCASCGVNDFVTTTATPIRETIRSPRSFVFIFSPNTKNE